MAILGEKYIELPHRWQLSVLSNVGAVESWGGRLINTWADSEPDLGGEAEQKSLRYHVKA